MKRMYGMKRFGRNVVNYASVFVMIYMASCFVLGIIGTVVSLVLSIVLTFGFGLDLALDQADALGPMGVALSVAFFVSLPIALVGAIWISPTEYNIEEDLRKDLKMHNRSIPQDSGKFDGTFDGTFD